jgi:glutamate dehydrogenase/leucine dehydrogenase
MTLKNAAAGLAHGGGKSVIIADPRLPPADKERLIRAFADAIRDLSDYIPGPDMGTDERCMAWIEDEIGRTVGLPRELGGIPLDEIGATGLGLAAAIDVAKDMIGLDLRGARVAVQGFGAVGRHVARRLAERGARIAAVGDSRGTIADPAGLDLPALLSLKAAGQSVLDHREGRKLERDAILDVECEIWIPAARPDVLHAGNVDRLKTRMVAEGANIPCTPEAELALERRGVLVLPDFVANAGGVICAAVEYHGGSESQALAVIEEKIRANIREVLERSRRERVSARQAAMALAEARVRAAMRLRRFG